MKRFLVKAAAAVDQQVDEYASDRVKTVKLADAGSSELSARGCADDSDYLTNTPDEQLLTEAGREFSGRWRYPQRQWFITHKWLQFSKSRKSVLCSWCREAIKSRVVGMSKAESSFTDSGFSNWKDGASKISEHSQSATH
jgi:hypothetical protein